MVHQYRQADLQLGKIWFKLKKARGMPAKKS
jgi:hypothetical protein